MKSIKKLLDLKNMTLEIRGYGYDYSIKKFMMQLVVMDITIIIASYFFQLNVVCILFLCIFALFCLPIIILAQFRYLASNKKYEVLVGYLEQMIFAFKKSPKILDAYKTIVNIVDKDMKQCIEKAITIIETDTTGNGYQNAFAMIEKEYCCTRVKALHKLMLNVEENGGDYQSSINILLDDIQTWVERTYSYQKELKGIKGKIILSIILSIGIAGTMTAFIPKELIVFGDSMIYLIATTILFMLLIGMLAFIQTKLNGKWLIDDTISTKDSVIISAMNILETHDKKVNRKKSIISLVITLPIMVVGVLMHSIFVIGLGVCISLFMFFYRSFTYKSSRKVVTKALEKEFPIWLRDISLQLQTLVVPLAIKNSIKMAPVVLKAPLEKLSIEIDKNPTSILPYNQFLKEYHLTDVSNAMKILFTIQTLSIDDAQNQIDDLVKRNQKMLAKGEKIRNKDVLGGIGFIVAFPMVVATLKLMVDLVLVMASFMSMSSGMLS